MRLQTPVLPRFSLIRIDIVVFFPHIISGSTRIPYTKLAVFIFTGSPSSANLRRKKCCVYTRTSKEDQVHGGIRMVRRAVHPILRHLCPRDDLQVL